MKDRTLNLSSPLLSLIVALMLVGISSQAWGQESDLDSTFHFDGKVTTAVGSFNSIAYAAALQQDGKLVVAGQAFVGSSVDFALARYAADGTLDTAFSHDGKLTTDIGGDDDFIHSVALQQDGKIIVAGFCLNGSFYDLTVARYTSAGVLDTTFNHSGKVIMPVGGKDDFAYALAVQSDGKILVAGYYFDGLHNSTVAIRFLSNGAVDTTFGEDGLVTTSISNTNLFISSLLIQPDGKIVVAGDFFDATSGGYLVIRYTSDGKVDTTFHNGGIAMTLIKSNADRAYSAVLQQDGKILVAGTGFNKTDEDYALVRYKSDGSLDTTFGEGGRVFTAVGKDNDYAYAVGIQSTGKIIVAGYVNKFSNIDFAVVRYESNGAIDSSFGDSGKVTTDFGAGGDFAHAMVIQPDDKIVVAGDSDNGSGSFAIARYGRSTTLAVHNKVRMALGEYALQQNYPNPFNPSTVISYQLPVTGRVTLKVYDAIGREVATLVNEVKEAEYYSATFDASKLSSGMYFYTLRANGFSQTRKLLLLK